MEEITEQGNTEGEIGRGVDPAQALLAMQKYTSNEISRLFMEIAMRDAYIQRLESIIKDLEEKLN